ncbi:MAG: hypothetical protein Q7R33_02905 [Nitrosarchaeum sp.]|nr:hypothetical protein [Nitrosarchaeum sp.]
MSIDFKLTVRVPLHIFLEEIKKSDSILAVIDEAGETGEVLNLKCIVSKEKTDNDVNFRLLVDSASLDQIKISKFANILGE